MTIIHSVLKCLYSESNSHLSLPRHGQEKKWRTPLKGKMKLCFGSTGTGFCRSWQSWHTSGSLNEVARNGSPGQKGLCDRFWMEKSFRHLTQGKTKKTKKTWKATTATGNIREWIGREFAKSQRAVEDRGKWRKLVARSSVVPQRPSRLRDWWWWWW